uniref:Uncharacterized protein n=1 Tax=viral metagenome TaxID=1070528 RepID=A0A6M3KG63_9ZZZZ
MASHGTIRLSCYLANGVDTLPFADISGYQGILPFFDIPAAYILLAIGCLAD